MLDYTQGHQAPPPWRACDREVNDMYYGVIDQANVSATCDWRLWGTSGPRFWRIPCALEAPSYQRPFTLKWMLVYRITLPSLEGEEGIDERLSGVHWVGKCQVNKATCNLHGWVNQITRAANLFVCCRFCTFFVYCPLCGWWEPVGPVSFFGGPLRKQ